MSILAIGEVVIDWISEDPGKGLDKASIFLRALGGNATNFAVGLSRLGHKVKLVGKVGNDFHGQYLKDILRSENIDISYLLTEDYPTAQCYVTFDHLGEPAYSNWPRPNAAHMLSPSDIEEKLLENIEIMHATGISLMNNPRAAAVEKIVDLSIAKKIVVSFDACFPTGYDDLARLKVENMIYKANILKFNYKELLFWSGGSTEDSVSTLAASLFEKYKPLALIATLASEGSYIKTEKGGVMCKPYAVNSCYPVGAGDAYMAGLVHGLKTVNGKINYDSLANMSLDDWQKASMNGNVAGALVTRQKSAYESFPSLKELELYLNEAGTK